jgi:hypothetical protein
VAGEGGRVSQWRAIGLLLFGPLLLLAACGQARATPTPLPSDVVRPVQPTPHYGGAAQFSLATPEAPAIIATTPVAPSMPLVATPFSLGFAALFDQPPSGLGIVTGGAALLEQPGGRSVASLPAGEIVTVTGKSSDDRFVAVYTNAFVVGWVATGQLTLYGADELEIVETAPNPVPLATLMTEVMAPVQVLDGLVATPPE